MSKWRKKPVVIDAFQWTGGPEQEEDPDWINDALRKDWGTPGSARFKDSGTPEVTLEIWTLEGVIAAKQGDYIIRGVKKEIYPCRPDIFSATYEKVETQKV